jgi:hypothetical protein
MKRGFFLAIITLISIHGRLSHSTELHGDDIFSSMDKGYNRKGELVFTDQFSKEDWNAQEIDQLERQIAKVELDYLHDLNKLDKMSPEEAMELTITGIFKETFAQLGNYKFECDKPIGPQLLRKKLQLDKDKEIEQLQKKIDALM